MLPGGKTSEKDSTELAFELSCVIQSLSPSLSLARHVEPSSILIFFLGPDLDVGFMIVVLSEFRVHSPALTRSSFISSIIRYLLFSSHVVFDWKYITTLNAHISQMDGLNFSQITTRHN
jgi:hypothetical protein